MENQRNEFRALNGNCVRTALVLVSSVADSGAEWHGDCIPPAGMDALAGSRVREKRVFRNAGGMAAFRNDAPGISSGGMGREAAFRKRIFRRRHGRFRASGSDWEIRFANLRRWGALPDNGTAGRGGLRLVPEAHPRQNGHQFRIELWNPFLKSCGGSARQRLC